VKSSGRWPSSSWGLVTSTLMTLLVLPALLGFRPQEKEGAQPDRSVFDFGFDREKLVVLIDVFIGVDNFRYSYQVAYSE
jgi:hypothetical protein